VPHTAFAPEATTNHALRAYLHGLPGVDEVGARARAQDLSTRSIKTTAKAKAIDLAISMVDLTTLEGADTPGKVRSLCAKAALPDPTDRTVPHVGAVCVYPDMVATAVAAPPRPRRGGGGGGPPRPPPPRGGGGPLRGVLGVRPASTGDQWVLTG
jgi:deoxyribose-phosphate aldolase